MLFERFTDDDLSHHSYAVGCAAAGELAIVDPRRDVDVYLDFAEEQGLEITRVLETHIHADFASGARELAERAGAELLVSGHDAGEDYEVAFAHSDLRHGDEVSFGSVRLRALHTPGHTPEHLSYLLFDDSRSAAEPMLLLSGDFLFVGSLGRPDLLGEEAKRDLAGKLFDSVRTVLADLPDGVEVHPAHGAGSMCGSGMSGRPQSTLGYERAANPYLDPSLTREEFVAKILGDVPPFPAYYRRMKRLNSDGPPLLGETVAGDGGQHGGDDSATATASPLALPGLAPIAAGRFAELAEDGDHVVVDLRHRVAFGGGHVPGSFGLGVDGKLSTWASWVLPYERPILLVAEEPADVEPAVRALVRVGLDRVVGYLDGGIMAWPATGRALAALPQVTPAQVFEGMGEGGAVGEGGGVGDGAWHLLDVRGAAEWADGHAPGAAHILAGELADRLEEVPRDGRPLAVVCGTGYRSTVAASVLLRSGFDNAVNVLGGMTAWQEAGLPVETG